MRMMLLPAKPGTCDKCAVDHEPWQAHNKQSLFYCIRFHGMHGREPTWADAVAHCLPSVQAQWKQMLEQRGAWSEHPEPIAEPYVLSS